MVMKYSYVFMLLLLVGISCDSVSPNEFVEENPKSILTDANFPQTPDDADALVNSMYSDLRNLYDNPYILFLTYCSEAINADQTSKGPGARLQFDGPAINRIGQIWSGFYEIIGRANLIISSVPELIEDQALRDKYLGEAYFIRAYSHYVIVRLYGPSIIRTEPIVELNDIAAPRMDENIVIQQVIEDFETAEELLPSQTGINRPNKFAAQTALSSVHLWAGNYQKTKDNATKVINSGQYRLIGSLAELYDPDEPATEEMMFLVRNDRQIHTSSSLMSHGYHSNYPYHSPNWTSTQGNENSFINIWDDEDLRKSWNLYDRNTPIPYEGDTVYADTDYIMAGYKFRDPNALGGSSSRTSYNYPVYRYAEVLLNYAEADIRDDGSLSVQGREYWNMVRRRGYGSDINQAAPDIDVPNGLSREDLMDEMLLERGKEFFYESKRWYDLKRFNKVEEMATQAGYEFNPRVLLWPLPIEEINNNSELTNDDQNPGY